MKVYLAVLFIQSVVAVFHQGADGSTYLPGGDLFVQKGMIHALASGATPPIASKYAEFASNLNPLLVWDGITSHPPAWNDQARVIVSLSNEEYVRRAIHIQLIPGNDHGFLAQEYKVSPSMWGGKYRIVYAAKEGKVNFTNPSVMNAKQALFDPWVYPVEGGTKIWTLTTDWAEYSTDIFELPHGYDYLKIHVYVCRGDVDASILVGSIRLVPVEILGTMMLSTQEGSKTIVGSSEGLGNDTTVLDVCGTMEVAEDIVVHGNVVAENIVVHGAVMGGDDDDTLVVEKLRIQSQFTVLAPHVGTYEVVGLSSVPSIAELPHLNPNPSFSDWPEGQVYPSSWDNWDRVEIYKSEDAFNGPFAVQLTLIPPNSNGYIAQDLAVNTAMWGRYYRFQYYAKGMDVGVQIMTFAWTKDPYDTAYLQIYTDLTTDWQTITSNAFLIPPGTFGLRLHLYCVKHDAVNANATIILGGGFLFPVEQHGDMFLAMDENARIGVGMTTPSYVLDLPNDASFRGTARATSWLTYAGRRSKVNIRSSPHGLATLQKLSPVTYEHVSLDKKQLGFIAEDVELVVPEVVHDDGKEKAIDYARLVTVAVQAIQEQQKMIQDLQEQVAMLKKQVGN